MFIIISLLISLSIVLIAVVFISTTSSKVCLWILLQHLARWDKIILVCLFNRMNMIIWGPSK